MFAHIPIELGVISKTSRKPVKIHGNAPVGKTKSLIPLIVPAIFDSQTESRVF